MPYDFDKSQINLKEKSVTIRTELFQLDYVNSQISFAILASIFCATILFIGLLAKNNHIMIGSWYIFSVSVAILQFWVVKKYKDRSYPVTHLRLRRKLFFLCVVLGSASWGAVSFLLFPFSSSEQQILIILILAGVTAGVIPALGAILSATISYLIIALLPLIIELFILNEYVYFLFNFALCAYLIYLVLLAIKTHQMINHIILLQVSNEKLVKNLSAANRQLSVMATHDPLTHADNSRLFYMNFTSAINRAERSNKLVALLYVDVDHFKFINDTYGHQFGDKMLQRLVDILKASLRKTDHIARLGGDEFTVILENISSKNDIENIAKKICARIAEPVNFEGKTIKMLVSIGISIYPENGNDILVLEKAADDAMYYAKQHFPGGFHFYKNSD